MSQSAVAPVSSTRRSSKRYSSPGRSESIRRYRNRASLVAEEVESGEWKSFLYSNEDKASRSGSTSVSAGAAAEAIPTPPLGRRRPSVSKKEPPYNLVIIGGGVAGASVAKALSKSKWFQVVLVDSAPYFENKLPIFQHLVDSSIESTVAVASQMSRHDEYLRSAIEAGKAAVKVGLVKDVTIDTVVLEDETITYDYLLVASGREYMVRPESVLSMRSLNDLSMELKRSEKVLVIGGGMFPKCFPSRPSASFRLPFSDIYVNMSLRAEISFKHDLMNIPPISRSVSHCCVRRDRRLLSRALHSRSTSVETRYSCRNGQKNFTQSAI